MSSLANKTLQKPPIDKEAKPQRAHKGEHPVDARLRILKEEVLPTVPYILSTVTSLTPEHVKVQYPQNEINWRKYTLFSRGEDELQYVTFKNRSSDHDIRGMYARGGWDDGKGKIAKPAQPHSRTSSDGTPHQGQVKKKKITLADYKNRDKSKAPQSAPTATAPKLKEGANGDDKIVDPAADNEDKVKPQQAEQHGQKRSADTMTGTGDANAIAHPPTSLPTKKARKSLEPSTASSKSRPEAKSQGSKAEATPATVADNNEEKPPYEASVAKSIPRTTSNKDQPGPTVTQATKPSMSCLPPMLSPLSSEIEEELAKMSSTVTDGRAETARSKTSLDSGSIKTSEVKRATTPTSSKGAETDPAEKPASVTKLPNSATPIKGSREYKQATASSSTAAKDVGSNNAATPKPAANGLSTSNKGTSTPTLKTTPDAPKRMRLRVVIAIKKKANKKNLANYLRMKPTPGRNSLFPHRHLEQQDPRSAVLTPEVKATNKATPRGNSKPSRPEATRPESKPEAPKTGDKRRRAQVDDEGHNEEPSSKRMPTGRITQTQKPSTPKPPPTSSPALSHLGSAQKPPTSTPRAELNGTAMLRAGSGQGSVHTPQPPAVNGTPDTGRRRRSYTSPDKPISPNSEDLRAEGSKYMATAIHLKHDADLFMKKQEGMSGNDRKRGILIGTESVLCFMTAFTLLDTQRNYSDRNAWKSILPYLLILQEAAKTGDLEHIRGLLSQLEGIIRDQIAYVDMQLLDKDPLKSNSGDPLADPSKVKERKAEEYYKHCHEFHSHFMKAQTAWRSGWMMLDIVDVQEQYPNTWAKRDKRRLAYGKARDAVFKGKYVRGYNLPMGNMTSGLEAVNFGLNLIAEWSQAAGVEWKPKLVLTE